MAITSHYPDISIPNVDLFEFLFPSNPSAPPDGNKVIFFDPTSSRSLTSQAIHAHSLAFSAFLQSQWHLKPGDTLAIFSPNDVDYASTLLGASHAGGVVSPVSSSFNARELAYQLKDSGASGVVTCKALLPVVKEAVESVGMDRSKIILIGEGKDKGLPHFEDIVKEGLNKIEVQKVPIKPEDLAFLFYSSGTTGLPKGVRLSHRNVVANVLQIEASDPGDWSNERVLAFLPMSHIYGFQCLLVRPILDSTATLIMPKFDLAQFLANIQNHHITVAYVVPPILTLLAKHPLISHYDLSSLTNLISAAAPLAASLIDAVYERIHIPVRQAFGISETSPACTFVPLERWHDSKGSVGFLVPNVSLKIVDASGHEVQRGQPGELCIRGPNVFTGYHNRPEATKAVFDEEGYFKTGDVGIVDKEGRVSITDRVKELIKFKGFQVAPAELEGIVSSHPQVVDCAVLGVYDEEQATEVPRAFVVPVEGLKRDEKLEESIVQWVKERVAGHKRLRGGVQFVDLVPKSATGKILRRELKSKFGTKVVPIAKL